MNRFSKTCGERRDMPPLGDRNVDNVQYPGFNKMYHMPRNSVWVHSQTASVNFSICWHVTLCCLSCFVLLILIVCYSEFLELILWKSLFSQIYAVFSVSTKFCGFKKIILYLSLSHHSSVVQSIKGLIFMCLNISLFTTDINFKSSTTVSISLLSSGSLF